MVFEIKHWDGGLSDYDDKGVRGAFKRGQNLDIRRDTDSLKAGQALAEEGIIEGGSQSASASPSVSAALTSVFRDLVHFFVKASDGNTYGFGNAGYIYKRDPEAN